MITYIALLRAINVGGHRRVAMPKLRDFVRASASPMRKRCFAACPVAPESDGRWTKMVVSSHPPWYLAFE
jgi:hypothetical protein